MIRAASTLLYLICVTYIYVQVSIYGEASMFYVKGIIFKHALSSVKSPRMESVCNSDAPRSAAPTSLSRYQIKKGEILTRNLGFFSTRWLVIIVVAYYQHRDTDCLQINVYDVGIKIHWLFGLSQVSLQQTSACAIFSDIYVCIFRFFFPFFFLHFEINVNRCLIYAIWYLVFGVS